MDNIFEYYTLKLTAKSPVFVGSGQSVSKKEFCYVPSKDVIRFMDMEKLIAYIAENIPERLEWFEKFMLDDHSLEKLGEHGKMCFTNGLNSFLNLIEMKVADRKQFIVYEIDNDGVFEKNRTICEIQRFMRGTDGRAYIPGSSVKGMLKTALLQYLIKKNPKCLPAETDIKYEGKNYDNELINTLKLKCRNGIPNKYDAVNSIMRGISISDSQPIPNSCFTVCKKTDVFPDGSGHNINIVRECIKPETEVTFQIKIDKRYFSPVGIDSNKDFCTLFQEIVENFDNEYKKLYLSKFCTVKGNERDFKDNFLVLGGGSGYFGKNIIYTRYGFEKGLKKVSDYMKLKRLWNTKKHCTYQPNPDDYHNHGISPHIIKLTDYRRESYHFGICSAELERKEI